MSEKLSLQAGPDAKSQINSIEGEKGSKKPDLNKTRGLEPKPWIN